ncbi:plasmid partitioning protein RepB [Brucella intermedia]|uniref:plasmid partitioning protein RepB n=1 Tax=Brucella intermedia TaxID=94625 RepID=UPI00124C0DDC|nr:plasmid partitioning protein RepB [Brucella intermedia]KAB2724333.1 plasmid partitioning protein RepB [Brucella intermedia]
MARKNLIGVSLDTASPSPQAPDSDITRSRPLAGFVPSTRSGPVGGITKSLTSITQKVERVDELERQLSEGQVVVELDPGLIDGSFVSDRLGIDPTELSELVDQIRENGQLVPILVRHNPANQERYQVAFGHRRLAAARIIGTKVRAVVRDLTDEQLVINQGQENNARTNLSYIERALFAERLEARGFTRDVIMSALAVDKAAVSKMLSVVKQISVEIIELIGAAPEIGRRRWMEFGELASAGNSEGLVQELSADNMRALESNERFQIAFEYLAAPLRPQKASAGTKVNRWASNDGSLNLTMNHRAKKVAIELTNRNANCFAEWLASRMDTLYDEFNQLNAGKDGE